MRTEKIELILLIGLLLIGYSWNIVIPQTIQITLREQPYKFTSLQFNLLYFAIFLPVLVLSIPFSSFFAKNRFSTFCLIFELLSFFFTLCLAFLFKFCVTSKILIIFCRGAFGLVNQAIMILRSLIIAKYFKLRYEQIVSVYFSLSFFVNSGALFLSQILFRKYQNVSVVWSFGCLISLMSLIGGILIFIKLRKVQERSLLKKQDINRNKQQYIHQQMNEKEYSVEAQIKSSNLSSIHTVSSQEEDKSEEHSPTQLEIISNLNNSFWVIVFTVLFTLLAIFPIADNLNQAFVVLYNVPQLSASFILTMAHILNGVLLFISGTLHAFIQRFKRTLFLISSILFFTFLAILQWLPIIQKSDNTPKIYYFCVFVFLVSRSLLLVSLWGFVYTSVVYFLRQKDLGVGLGILQTVVGLGQCLGPLINSFLLSINQDLKVSYKYFFFYYTCISSFAILTSFWIKIRPQFDILDSLAILKKSQENLDEKISQTQNQEERKRKSWIYLLIVSVMLLAILIIFFLNFQHSLEGTLFVEKQTNKHNFQFLINRKYSCKRYLPGIN